MEDVFGAFALLIAAAGPLAIGVTKIVDMIRNLVDPTGTRFGSVKVVWSVAAFVVAFAVCFGWQFNVVEGFVVLVPALRDMSTDGFMGYALTALVVGGTASYWHERMDLASSRAKAARVDALRGDTHIR